MRQTANIGLTLFDENDRLTLFPNYNEDNEKIDAAYTEMDAKVVNATSNMQTVIDDSAKAVSKAESLTEKVEKQSDKWDMLEKDVKEVVSIANSALEVATDTATLTNSFNERLATAENDAVNAVASANEAAERANTASEKVNTFDDRIAEVEKKTGDTDTSIGTVEADLTAVNARIDDLGNILDDRVKTLNDKNVSQDANILEAQTGINSLTQSLSELEEKVDNIETGGVVNETDISALDGRVTTLETQYNSLNGKLLDMSDDIDSMNDTIDSTVQSVSDNSNTILTVQSKTNDLESRLLSVESVLGSDEGGGEGEENPSIVARVDTLEESVLSLNEQQAVNTAAIQANASAVEDCAQAYVDSQRISTITVASGATSAEIGLPETVGSNAYVQIFCSTFGRYPNSVVASGNSVKLTFDAAASNEVWGVRVNDTV